VELPTRGIVSLLEVLLTTGILLTAFESTLVEVLGVVRSGIVVVGLNVEV